MRYLLFALSALLLACTVPTDNLQVPAGVDPYKLGQSIPPLDSLDVSFTAKTLYVGGPGQICAYWVFTNGLVAMRSQDAPQCSVVYVANYTLAQRTISPHVQRWVDQQCLLWTPLTSNVTVVSDYCPLV